MVGKEGEDFYRELKPSFSSNGFVSSTIVLEKMLPIEKGINDSRIKIADIALQVEQVLTSSEKA